MRLELSEYRGVWLVAMFDLPVDDQEARRSYTRFRNLLLKEGFNMLQFSVYARYFASEAVMEPFRKRIKKGLPPAGQVRLLLVTDKQFAKMENYQGRKRAQTEAPPDQMMLF